MTENVTIVHASPDHDVELVVAETGKPKLRTLIGAVPAAGITFGLFVAMDAMIGIDAAPAETAKEFTLVKITPQIPEPGESDGLRKPISKISASAPPPDLPPVTIHKVPTFIPGSERIGKAPERIERTGAVLVDLGTVAITKQATPIGPLNVVYPSSMAARELEGDCEVRFDLNPRGEAYNIKAECTHGGFESSARRAVSKAKFSPRMDSGVPMAQTNMIFPIEFRFDRSK